MTTANATELAALHGLAAVVRMLARTDDVAETRLHLGYDEAAKRLNIPEKWLRERISSLPHRKLGKFVQFTEDDLRSISEMHFVQPHQHVAREESPDLLAIRPSARSRRRA